MIRNAMILAAGRGERMRPLTDVTPKPLIPVAGRSMLERSMDRLQRHGVQNVVVNVHHLGNQIADRLQGRARIIREDHLLETGGSVRNALPLLGNGPFFVLNGDGLWRDGPESMLGRLQATWDPRRMDALLLLHPLATAIGREEKDRGDYYLEPDGHVRHRGAAETAPYLFASISVCEPSLFNGTSEGPFSLLKLWNRSEAAGRLYGLVHDGQWFHVGTPAALADAHRVLG